MPPATAEVRHYHETAEQFFYVLRGALSLEIAGEEVGLTAGQGASVPPGEAHLVRNRSSVDAEFLVISSPPTTNDRFPV
jgi:mannose-6-phosphate isomerase-like protein (cupin superfamily)